MIKFFRHLRQSFIMKNQSARYLQYAIGEILLVVIGILIALQVNNWNENRKDIQKEQTILQQIKEEYMANLQQLDDKMQLRTIIIQSGLTLLDYMDDPTSVQADSIIFHLSNIVYDPTFDPIQNDLISSGNIRLIRNDKLRQLLSHWSSDIIAVQEQEKINQIHAHEIMLPLFNELGITRYILNALWENMGTPYFLLDKNADAIELDLGKLSGKKSKAKEIINNVELEGVVSGAISYNKLCNIQSQTLKNRIQEILLLITREIN